MDCISTGETEYEGKAFIVHSNSGGRVGCGLLESISMVDDPTGAPIATPTDAPITGATDAPVAAPDEDEDEESASNTVSCVVAIASSVVGVESGRYLLNKTILS
ncbi:unnamed protein product [Cylindrotheca closterium]|uniref:Superoxide dismutase copper/zinc binding domain-containing protein n=1 Tax=Cylindrotheca closterium TaxID=2856 RepID=A0AAD2JMT7_9STRA|nr:unnamed protein product [Cylindrotheca closterium]